MIFWLTGTTTAAGAAWFVIDVRGVGFCGHCTPATAIVLRSGEARTIHTFLVVCEESLMLFGLGSDAGHEAFELVQSISEVGPRVVPVICSVLFPSDLRRAIPAEDLRALCRVSGIGNKSAQKLVLELKDKAGPLALGNTEPVKTMNVGAANELWRGQAMKSLQGPGWSAKRAGVACDTATDLAVGGTSVAQLMRAVLGTLTKR